MSVECWTAWLRVSSRTVPAEGIVELELVDPDGGELPEWSPGAHVDVAVGDGGWRQYSLCGDPADRSTWRIVILRVDDGRGGSRHLHDEVAQANQVLVRGPRNHFPFRKSPDYLFVAGGIGVTPLLPMIRAAETAGSRWQLVYGGRTIASMAYARELAHTYGDKVTLVPQDVDGILDLDDLLGTPLPETLVYCCGPATLLRAVENRCAAWPPGSLFLERFTPELTAESPCDLPEDAACEIELANSGIVLNVPPDQSLLDAVLDAGVDVIYSCEEGTCGSCETPVISGEVLHRDSILTDEEKASNATMMLCVSRAACHRLVLDL